MRTTIIALLICLTSSVAFSADKVTMALNWVPEPEFGGIYNARENGTFAKNNLDVDIKAGGAGVPTWQRVAKGDVEFGVSSADEVIIARSNGADVVAIFATYQTCPQGIMVHASRGLKTIDEVFKGGTLAIEIGLPYSNFLEKKYGFKGVKRVPYTGGVAAFMADKNYAQQCFVTSEPLDAKKLGGDPQTFLIADSGYNPYTAVVITSGKYAKDHPVIVANMLLSLEVGWQDYLNDPKPANAAMAKLNKNMTAETFAAAAKAQQPLIEYADGQEQQRFLGQMTNERWKTLIDQLVDLKVVKNPPKSEECVLAQAPAPAPEPPVRGALPRPQLRNLPERFNPNDNGN